MTDAQFGVGVCLAIWLMGVSFPIALRFLWTHEKPQAPLIKLVLIFVAFTLGWTFALDRFISWLRGLPPDPEDES